LEQPGLAIVGGLDGALSAEAHPVVLVGKVEELHI